MLLPASLVSFDLCIYIRSLTIRFRTGALNQFQASNQLGILKKKQINPFASLLQQNVTFSTDLKKARYDYRIQRQGITLKPSLAAYDY